MKAHDRFPDGFFVGERFAHAHVHHIADATIHAFGALRSTYNLFDDFAGGEVAGEASLPCCTKATSHRATCLGAHTHGGAVGIDHENGFDAASAIELPQELDGGVVIRNDFINQHQRVR